MFELGAEKTTWMSLLESSSFRSRYICSLPAETNRQDCEVVPVCATSWASFEFCKGCSILASHPTKSVNLLIAMAFYHCDDYWHRGYCSTFFCANVDSDQGPTNRERFWSKGVLNFSYQPWQHQAGQATCPRHPCSSSSSTSRRRHPDRSPATAHPRRHPRGSSSAAHRPGHPGGERLQLNWWIKNNRWVLWEGCLYTQFHCGWFGRK